MRHTSTPRSCARRTRGLYRRGMPGSPRRNLLVLAPTSDRPPHTQNPFFPRYRAQMQFWCRGWRPDRVGRAERGRQESDLGARFRLEVATALAYIPCSHTLGRSGHGVQASTLDPKLPRPLNDLKPILTVVDAYWDSGEALPRPVPGDSPTRYPAVLVAPLTVWS